MTVRELRDALGLVPDTLTVIIEGCDCEGEPEGLIIEEDRVILARSLSHDVNNEPRHA